LLSLGNKNIFKISIPMLTKTDIKNRDSLQNYFQFLCNKNYDKLDYQGIKHTQDFFWNLLDWQIIFDEIENCILKNFYKENAKNQKISYFIRILKK
jgi:hypothetical protein